MSTVVKWLSLLFLMTGVTHASSDLVFNNRTELIHEIEALQALIESQKALRQSQVTLLNQSLGENNISNGTTVAPYPTLNSSKAECSDAIFAGSLFFNAATIITGFVGPVIQFVRYRNTYGKTGADVSFSAFFWPVLAFTGSALFLTNVGINQNQSWLGRLLDSLPSSTAAAANTLVYASLVAYKIRYYLRHSNEWEQSL